MDSRILGSLLCAAVVFASGCSWTEESRSDEILFVRETAKGAAIFLMTDDGREVRRLVEGTSPRWSPDGSRFAYTVDYEGEETRYCGTSVWVMNPDTGARRRVANVESGLLVCSLAWAPDGVRLAYSDGSGVSVLNTETGASEAVSLEPAPPDGPMDWSHDGRELILSWSFSSSTVLDTRTGAERGFGRKPSAGDGRWSPDGERVALAVSSPLTKARLRRVIVLANPDGRNREEVTHGAFDSEPAWSPDGKRIYFSRMPASGFGEDKSPKQEMYALDLETRALRQLTRNNVVDRLPDVQPEDRVLPPVPEPVVGDVVVPDLVDRHVLLEYERQRFRKLGLRLKAVPPLVAEDGVLVVVREQVPRGGARTPRRSVVKVTGSDFGVLTLRRKFSVPMWRAHPGCAGAPEWRRFEMYGDLVRHVLRRGMTRQRVVSLLGEPQRSEGRWSDWALARTPYLHTEPVDCIYLRVEFNEKGRAVRFHQWAS